MMDLKEIIKWFIPCFHILPLKKRKMVTWTIVCLFIFFNSCAEGRMNSVGVSALNSTKNLDDNLIKDYTYLNQSEAISENNGTSLEARRLSDNAFLRRFRQRFGTQFAQRFGQRFGRTFGRPFMKKMMGAIMPLVFQVGAASTWAIIAALVGFKTLLVTLAILKLLLVAGAAKIGALFATKGHEHNYSHSHSHGWETPPQKEIHLHIHNGQTTGGHVSIERPSYSSWNREGVVIPDPYRGGPQTISTPFGNYVKIEPSTT